MRNRQAKSDDDPPARDRKFRLRMPPRAKALICRVERHRALMPGWRYHQRTTVRRSTTPWELVILMTMSEFSSVADAKAHLSELVSRVGSQHDRVTVTVHGRPTAVLLAVDDLEALEETISILSDAAAVRALATADSELARGQGETEDALRKAMRARRASA